MSDNDISKSKRVIKGSIKSGAAWEIHHLIESGNFNAKSLFDSCHKELELDGRRIIDVKRNVHDEIDKSRIKISNVLNVEQSALVSSNNSINLTSSEQNAIHRSDANLKNSDSSEPSTDNEKQKVLPPNNEDIKKLREEKNIDTVPSNIYSHRLIDTVAVCKVDLNIKLNKTKFNGFSRAIRGIIFGQDNKALPKDIRFKLPPKYDRQFNLIEHAEVDVLNQVDKEILKAIDLENQETTDAEAKISEKDIEGTVYIHISNAGGVCNICTLGLLTNHPVDGVIKQTSLTYPNVTFVFTSDVDETVKITGTRFFKVQNGKIFDKER